MVLLKSWVSSILKYTLRIYSKGYKSFWN